MPFRSILRRIFIASALAVVAVPAAAADAKTTWLCRPGLAANPCDVGLNTTNFSLAGERLGVTRATRPRSAPVDCFYVYPTVSDQQTVQATLAKDPEIRSIALYQAARYSEHCRVYVPVYRQVTVKGINPPTTAAEATAAFRSAYRDIEAAWKEYLATYNRGRGVVLIGHSQGTFHLRQLVRTQIDTKPAVRKRLISAILLGGNVGVKKGASGGKGGDFLNVPACRRASQLGCVIAFSMFGSTPPADARFGRAAGARGDFFGNQRRGDQILCTNPASLAGGSGLLDPGQPTEPFAPGTAIAAGIQLVGYPEKRFAASTPWAAQPGAFTATCSTAGGASFLKVTPRGGIKAPNAIPDATWGLHLLDANLPLGNLLKIVRSQAAAYVKQAK